MMFFGDMHIFTGYAESNKKLILKAIMLIMTLCILGGIAQWTPLNPPMNTRNWQ